jgi:hypothetical protein
MRRALGRRLCYSRPRMMPSEVSSDVPALSIVLVLGARRDRAAGALLSLLTQSVVDRMEVLLFDLAPGEPPPLPGSDHPAVRLFRLPPETLFSTAKAHGIRRATAPVVAFLEEHCRAHPGWAAALLAAHEGPWAAVGAEVHNGNPEVALSRWVEILNYRPWMAPAERGEHGMLPGHNSSFKRDILLAYGEELDDLLRAEIVLHVRLHRDGHRLLLEPAARFSHINESTLASAALGRFLWNRIYGSLRARTFRWPLSRRLFYVAATFATPFYSLALTGLFLARERPELLGRLLAGAPAIFILQLASGLGFSLGLAAGTGSAEARFSLYEMNEFRRYRERREQREPF